MVTSLEHTKKADREERKITRARHFRDSGGRNLLLSRRALRLASESSEDAAASPPPHFLVRQRISELLDLLGMMDGRERPVAQSLQRLRQQE